MFKNKIYYSAYLGVFLLYLKLLFGHLSVSLFGSQVNFSFLFLTVFFFRVFCKLIFLKINLFKGYKAGILFWIYLCISTILSFFLSPQIAAGVVTVNLQLFFLYLIYIDIKTSKINVITILKLINGLQIFAFINAILVVYTFFFGKIGFLGEVSEGSNITRAFGLMGDQVAWFLSFFATYCLYSRKKYLFIFYLICILMSASLGATIILVVGTIYYYYKNKKLNPAFYIKTGVITFILLTMTVTSSNMLNKIGVVQRIERGDFSNTEETTSGHRSKAITHAITKIKEKPLLGYQNYSLTMFNDYDRYLSEYEKGNLTYLTTPNNQALAIVCDYGIVGFIFFIFFIYSFIKRAKPKNIKLPPNLQAFKNAVYGWLIIFIIFNQSATWFLPGSFLLILIYMLIGISSKIDVLYHNGK